MNAVVEYDPQLPAAGVQTRTAQLLVIECADTRQMASDWANAAKVRRNKMDDERREWVDPLNAYVKKLNGKFNAVIHDYDAAIDVAKAAMLTYDRAEVARVAAAQAEANRIAAEARAAAEAEAKKLEKTDPVQAAVMTAVAAVITAPAVLVTKAKGDHTRKKWKARLVSKQALVMSATTDPAALAMLDFDQAGANLVAAATKGQSNIPGVEFYEDESVVLK